MGVRWEGEGGKCKKGRCRREWVLAREDGRGRRMQEGGRHMRQKEV
jgi:hypothetical protein